ncbi:hypothetical protein BBIA_1866 [Bifidobacterium biavatii DSM 23969]|uniref:Lipoprotein n=1 Tax=Bifidobacterium biavatii DSM 23969 TaxID=1437608 RepID=A0A086ZTU4_9BIFI|nr:hypothetical protein BBIA_1866 [Bifidobacterium biavatii DSM 23969]
MNQTTLAKRIITLVCAGFYISALAGCGQTVSEDGQGQIDCADQGAGYALCSYKVPIGETRYVTCVEGAHSLSCDWAHADGADPQ